jgi:hypothetical protein
MSLLRTVIEHFVVPPGDRRPDAAEALGAPGEGAQGAGLASRTPAGVAVLAAPADAHALGAALGLALAGHRRAPVVVLCVWTAGPAAGPTWGVPALPAARRMAAALCARGHDARAAGRLAVVRLPAQPDEAAAQARRATAAAGSAPSVVALGGPRVAALDALLSEQDLVVVAASSGTDHALARLALAGLQSTTARACVCEVPPARPARAVAAAGLTLLPSARRAIAGTVETLT